MKLNRLLSGIVVVLVLIIISEVIYLLVKPKSNDTALEQAATQPVETSPTPTPYQNAAIDKTTIDSLKNIQVFKEGVLKNAILNYTVGGRIMSIKDITRKDQAGNDEVVKSIEIQGDKGYSNTFFFNKERQESVIVKEGSQEAQISFNDLKENDSINILYTINILKDLNYDDTISNVVIEKK